MLIDVSQTSLTGLVFVSVVPLVLAVLSAYASRPDEFQYGGNREDLRLEQYRWAADVGLDCQLAGLTTLTGAILLLGYTNWIGLILVLSYTLVLCFGLARYRDHRYAPVTRNLTHNHPFVIGVGILVCVEVVVTMLILKLIGP